MHTALNGARNTPITRRPLPAAISAAEFCAASAPGASWTRPTTSTTAPSNSEPTTTYREFTWNNLLLEERGFFCHLGYPAHIYIIYTSVSFVVQMMKKQVQLVQQQTAFSTMKRSYRKVEGSYYLSTKIVLRWFFVYHGQYRLALRQWTSRLAIPYPQPFLLVVSLVKDLHRRYR